MTNALTTTRNATETYERQPRRVPCINLQQAARNLSQMAIPLVTLGALSSLPTANGWFGSNPQLYVACMDGCDRIPEDLIKLACYTSCWIFS